MFKTIKALLFFATVLATLNLKAAEFVILNGNARVTIVYSLKGPAIDSITAHLLAEDIESVTGYLPAVMTNVSKAKGNAIVIGNIHSIFIQGFLNKQSSLYKNLSAKQECYGLKVINQPSKNLNNVLVIAGSDSRGTAYGVFDISEKIGVSPWYWWADVRPNHQVKLSLNLNEFVSYPPSVKYRGIFINDEDWGLQPWAAKTFEPETKDIGPKTYAKVFELLLRLKANLIWPAMHPSTKAFYSYPGNKKVAADYSIIVGSSHAEPMLRNNVGEWDTKTMGAFNFISNKANVYKYWEDRVKESSTNEAIYTLGMRGVHDSGIEGVKTPGEAVPLIERIFKDQRMMLQKYINKDVTAVPQVFTAYKEVLDIYDSNLKLPEDITLVWPDDNYGYIQRLNNEKEQTRKGGSGIYYHASYWGRPHDYLWLSTTDPSLIREEMMKAYEMKADKLWVLNVGDIKPLEYNIQLFLDMAYNALPFKDSRYVKRHMIAWASKTFGEDKAEAIQSVLWDYYKLAFERRPEFMGWSQTEPTTQTTYTEYNHFNYGDEAQRRIDKYEGLEKQVKELRSKINPKDSDAFYELVYYPIVCASLMNKKFLYRDKSYLYAKQNRLSAFDYSILSKQAFDSIVSETNCYNTKVANGKWNNIMSMMPRGLPAYQPPVLPVIKIDRSNVWSIAPEDLITRDSSMVNPGHTLQLPQFNSWDNKKYFIDIFLNDDKTITWTCSTSGNWISLSQQSGILSPEFGKKQIRIWVSIDWTKVAASQEAHGILTITGAGKTFTLNLLANNSRAGELNNYKGFTETNGYVSIHASNFNRQTNHSGRRWQVMDGLGHTGTAIEALPLLSTIKIDTSKLGLLAATHVEYDFYSFTSSPPEVQIFSLPTHPLNKNYSMRYAVSIDEGPLKIVDFKTIGRSEEWKQNVLRNSAVKKVKLQSLKEGKHVLKIFMIDPGVILDRIIVDFGGQQKVYGNLDESR